MEYTPFYIEGNKTTKVHVSYCSGFLLEYLTQDKSILLLSGKDIKERYFVDYVNIRRKPERRIYAVKLLYHGVGANFMISQTDDVIHVSTVKFEVIDSVTKTRFLDLSQKYLCAKRAN
ncbi:unnamed protein product [Dibothriocephalus latus]|uniref:Uncharacterized protein n=1 Tax=Dibothriocephalus latus TaxID=60516 RepID=A0A3P7M0R5_DIBLA|nr:unnamed protein product [Dibothriocephalus latus]